MIDGRFQLVSIPTRDHHPLTRSLVNKLLADGEVDKIVVYDNETRNKNGLRYLDRIRGHDRIEVKYWHGDGVIYEMWNDGWQTALDIAEETGLTVDLTTMNNDIDVPPGVIGHLSRALRAETTPDGVWITYPDYKRKLSQGVDITAIRPTCGTFRKGGMCGFCYMIKPEKHLTDGWPFIDLQFRWLAGDGDLCSTMQERGATAARVVGLPMDFQIRATSHDARNKQWVSVFRRQDMRRSRVKWAHGTKDVWERNWGRVPDSPSESA